MFIEAPNYIGLIPFLQVRKLYNCVEINNVRVCGRAEEIFKTIQEKIKKIQKNEKVTALLYADDDTIISVGIIVKRFGSRIYINNAFIPVENAEVFFENIKESLNSVSIYHVIPIAEYLDSEFSQLKVAHNEDINLLKEELSELKEEGRRELTKLQETINKLMEKVNSLLNQNASITKKIQELEAELQKKQDQPKGKSGQSTEVKEDKSATSSVANSAEAKKQKDNSNKKTS